MRFKRRLHQQDLAEIFGVTVQTYASWERGSHQPLERFYPRIFAFLGYIPDFMLAEDARHKASDYGQWIAYRRRLKGMGPKAFAERVGVERGTVYLWEDNRRLPYPRLQKKILEVLEPLDIPLQPDPSNPYKCTCSHRRGPRIPV